jgi:hypothetical protein
MNFISWPKIVSFYNIRKFAVEYPEMLNNKNSVIYRSKVKLHGTNAAIQILSNEIGIQSREKMITPQNDNAGFATWVDKNKTSWGSIAEPLKEYIVFGEWCGPGINKGCAIHSISNKIFAVFAIVKRHMQLNILEPYQEDFIVEPSEIAKLLPNIPGVYVLPWYGEEIVINWLEDSVKLESIADTISSVVDVVENCDPWIKDVFNIEGVGEGLVYYPTSHSGMKSFANLSFKAKGEKHKIIGSIKAAQVAPPKSEDVEAFVSMVLTDARLDQAIRAIANGELKFEVRNTGKFLEWIVRDIQKETSDELEASKLEWKAVSKVIATRAREWYMSKLNNKESI